MDHVPQTEATESCRVIEPCIDSEALAVINGLLIETKQQLMRGSKSSANDI